ncbi:sarcosine oxidase subunit gamma [Methylocapsa sp. S129]|uniref:sarcosine oxidase subunit gamma n=1 Tax=Methylocapsa sp. S129 TaxID=1641869 RepID=UPI00131D9603|nr:sarcosine oxidase subunit gamma family protein [Methylocapsa sp. S129]
MADPSLKTKWSRHSAWADILTASPSDAARPCGVNVVAREGLGVAGIQAQRGRKAALSALVKMRYGLELPTTPRAVRDAAHAFVWAGPGQWLLVAEQKESFAELSELAAVSDQSDGRAALRLSGPNVRDMLAKGCMIDLHPAAFPSGAAAMTSIAHIGVHLWRVDEQPYDRPAIFDILVARSMAASFWSWASASAAEYN